MDLNQFGCFIPTTIVGVVQRELSDAMVRLCFIPTTIVGVVQLCFLIAFNVMSFIPTTIAGVVQLDPRIKANIDKFYTHYNCGCCTTSKSRFTEW